MAPEWFYWWWTILLLFAAAGVGYVNNCRFLMFGPCFRGWWLTVKPPWTMRTGFVVRLFSFYNC